MLTDRRREVPQKKLCAEKRSPEKREIVMVRKLEATGHDLITGIHPHPTMSEAVMEAAAQAYGECIHL
jgi:hypothetical protein